MKAPTIYVVVREGGEYSDAWWRLVSWHFDEREADDEAARLQRENAGESYAVEKVEAAR